MAITVSQAVAQSRSVSHRFTFLGRTVGALLPCDQITYSSGAQCGDSTLFEPVTAGGKARLNELGLADRPFVLVPGGLHFRKNAELILEAWPLIKSLHPDLVLAIVNHSNPEYVERAKFLGGSLRVLGFVPDDALRALYSAAQVVWFPSRYEGFGLPVVEAMACGAPVVASRGSSLPEIAGDAALLASPHRPKDHVDALHNLLSDESLRREFANRGRNRASHFTWDKSANQLRGYFEALL